MGFDFYNSSSAFSAEDSYFGGILSPSNEPCDFYDALSTSVGGEVYFGNCGIPQRNEPCDLSLLTNLFSDNYD